MFHNMQNTFAGREMLFNINKHSVTESLLLKLTDKYLNLHYCTYHLHQSYSTLKSYLVKHGLKLFSS